MRKTIIYIAGILFALAIGFFIGRQTIDKIDKIVYEKGEIVSGSVDTAQFIPIKEEAPEKPELPLKPMIIYQDTGSTKYILQIIDTAAIIADYIKKREYQIKPFDNKEFGKLELYPMVQYNKLIGFDYSFTPVTQIRHREKGWQPFVSASYSTLDYLGIGGGIFYRNLGFEYQYQLGYRSTQNGHSFGLKYKF